MIYHISSEELPELEQMANEFFKESEYPGKFNFPFFCEFWSKVFELDMGRIIVCQEKGALVGVIGFTLCLDIMTGYSRADESFWFVSKDYRGSSIGFKLFKAYEDSAINSGAVSLNIAHLMSNDNLGLFYKRCGYNAFHKQYVKEV